jgi:hypothetical protein
LPTFVEGDEAIHGVLLPEASSSEGNPFETGAVITFSNCQESTEPVLLYTATVLPAQSGYTPQIALRGIESPTNPSFPCPNVSCNAAVTCLPEWVSTQQILVPPHMPFPPDDATGVSPLVVLHASYGNVCECLGLPCIDLYFGTDPDPPIFRRGL